MSDLHAAIMNLPCKHGDWSGENGNMAYKIGHRDARHAAAELASEYAASHQRLKEALERATDALEEAVGYVGSPMWSPSMESDCLAAFTFAREALRSAP